MYRLHTDLLRFAVNSSVPVYINIGLHETEYCKRLTGIQFKMQMKRNGQHRVRVRVHGIGCVFVCVGLIIKRKHAQNWKAFYFRTPMFTHYNTIIVLD